MLGFLIIASPFLAIIFWLWFRKWKAFAADDLAYPKTLSGFLQFQFEFLSALAGGVAFALLIDAFAVEKPSHVFNSLLAAAKGILCVSIVSGILIAILRSLKGFGAKCVVHGCVLILVGLWMSRPEHDDATRVRAEARDVILPR